jgi:uncharacterized protein YqjF (DUF2071 family)
MVSPVLDIDVYDGYAWLIIETFHLDKLYLDMPLFGWVDSHTSGWIVKTKALVSYKGRPGQLIWNMDFDKSVSGWIQSLGCSITQHGIDCRMAKMNMWQEKGRIHQTAISSDGARLNSSFALTNATGITDFTQWVLNHYQSKVVQSSSGSVYIAEDQITYSKNETFTLVPYAMDTNFLSLRYKLNVDVSTICKNRYCFLIDSILTLIDYAAKKAQRWESSLPF